MIEKNQEQIFKSRHIINIALFLIFLFLLFWVLALLYKQIKFKESVLNNIQSVNYIDIKRKNGDIVLNKKSSHWLISKPFTAQASDVVVNAFLQRLDNNCLVVDKNRLSRKIEFYAKVNSNLATYEIGELNSALDRVYVNKKLIGNNNSNLFLCDKLLVSIALAPAIKYIKKYLYLGNLISIKGSFGTINNVKNIDLSILQIEYGDKGKIEKTKLSNLSFITDKGKFEYKVLPIDPDKKHLILFNPSKSLIYVIPAYDKLISIIGF